MLVLLLVMSSEIKPSALSASKLRRIRGAATKQRLYESALKEQPLYVIQSQLAMLTTSLDSFMHYFIVTIANTSMTNGNEMIQSTLNPSAHEFTPPPNHVSDHKANSADSHSPATPHPEKVASINVGMLANHCVSCWEPLPSCHCSASVTCRGCVETVGTHQHILPQEGKAEDEAISGECEVKLEVHAVLEIMQERITTIKGTW